MENEKEVEIKKNENNFNNNKIKNNLKKSNNENYGELTREQFELIKKIKQETISRTERYSEMVNNIKSEEILININKKNNKLKKNINESIKDDTFSNMNTLNILNTSQIEEIDPYKERIFNSSHPFLFIKEEPLIILGPDTHYYVLIFSIVSFLSIIIYSLKNSKIILRLLFICGYLFFSITYTLLLLLNPGFPTNKKNLDLNMLQSHYNQCKMCNGISLKQEGKLTLHCDICKICIEHFDHHCTYATKCIGRNNKIIFKLWLYSIGSFFTIIFLYLIF